MGMGRRQEDRQQEFWIASDALASVPGHVFYDPTFPIWVEPETDPGSRCRDCNTLRPPRV
jgi:hypothetical protein